MNFEGVRLSQVVQHADMGNQVIYFVETEYFQVMKVVPYSFLCLAAHRSRKWDSSDKMFPKWSQDSQGGTAKGTNI